MIKKGLVKTLIYEYIDDNKLDDVGSIINNMPNIYEYLRNHPNHGDVLPKELTYQEFFNHAHNALIIAHFRRM